MNHRWFHYVRLDELADWLMCGWMPTTALVETHHGFYAMLCEFPCSCPIPRPGRTPAFLPHDGETNG